MSTPMLIIILAADTLASGFLGWLVGRTARNAEVVAAEVAEIGAEGDDDLVGRAEHSGRARAFLARVRAPYVAMAMLAVVTGVTAFLTGTSSIQQTRIVHCVVDYSNELADSLKASREANADVQTAQDKIWFVVADAFAHPSPDDRERIADAIDEYNALRTTQRASQRANPLPAAPRGACADLLE